MKKDQKEAKPNGYCPECGGQSFGIPSQRSTRANRLYPWSMVLKSYHCQKCNTEIPAHLWNCKVENESKAKLEWNKLYRNGLGLFESARRNGDADSIKQIIKICDTEINEALLPEDAEEYFHIRIMCLIYLNKKREARDWALRAISAIPNLNNKKIYVIYICLCLDTGDGEAAVFAFDLYKNEVKDQNLDFLRRKVKSAAKKGILSKSDLNKLAISSDHQNCPICLSPVKTMSRYPNYVCAQCKQRATDKAGRLVRFSQQPSAVDPFGLNTLKAYYLENNKKYESSMCWIDGTSCEAEVARFGGIVIQKLLSRQNKQSQASQTNSVEQVSNTPIPINIESEIEYVDPNGNPINAEDIDLATVEFEDEFGRNVDFKGNLIEMPESEVKWVQIAEKMLAKKAFQEMIRHCRAGLATDKNKSNSKLWSLLGIGLAATGKTLKAKESFLQSINCSPIDQIDSITFANFVTASFELGDSKSGLLAIEKFFDDLNYDGKRIILDSLLEAVRTKLISREDLSERLLTLLMIK